MTSSPQEAEARGQEQITAVYADRDWLIPVDVDTWPLASVRACLVVDAEKKLRPNHRGVVAALQLLLGEQWPAFLEAAPKLRQLVEASHAFAAAVGMPQRPDADSDVAFGALPWLLYILDRWPTQVESDLQQFWGLDYLDRFRFTAGRRNLTLRAIHARLSNVPTTSAVAIALNNGKALRTGAELLLMDLFEASTGVRHPSRPLTKEQIEERDAAAAKAAKDKAAHDARMEARRDRQKSSAMDRAKRNAQVVAQGEAAHA